MSIPPQELGQDRNAAVGRSSMDKKWDAVYLNRFVGREKELQIFQKFLNPSNPLRVLLIDGPATIGKSALLWRYGLACKSAGVPYRYIDLILANGGGQVENILLQNLGRYLMRLH